MELGFPSLPSCRRAHVRARARKVVGWDKRGLKSRVSDSNGGYDVYMVYYVPMRYIWTV
jgi:hypothetical protein